MNLHKIAIGFCIIFITEFGFTWASLLVKDDFPHAEQCREPDNTASLSAEQLKFDNDCRHSMSGFQIEPPNTTHLIGRSHISGSDILNLFTNDNFRNKKCGDFNRLEPCILSYIRIREQCMDISDIFVKLGIGLYRVMCSSTFEETLSDVFNTVGDGCIDGIYRQVFNSDVIPIDTAACKETVGKAFEDVVSNGKRFEYIKSNLGTRIINNCFLTPVQLLCGEIGKTQMKRLTDLYMDGLNF